MKLNREYSFYIFTISVLIFLIAPTLLADGMFMDGQQYACVSNNLYHGSGSFWRPFLSHVWFMNGSQAFMEHPPLFYWIESRVFFVFGDSIYSERIFSLLMLVCNAFMIHKIWQLIFIEKEYFKKHSWLPVFLWIVTPICFWTFQNNMIEMLVSLFALLSVYFAYKALLYKRLFFLNITIAGICMFLGFLTKGFVALFPLGIYFIYFLFNKNSFSFKQFLINTTLLVFIPSAIFFGLIFFNDNAKESLFFYLSERLVSRIQTTSTTDYRIWILLDLLSELIPVFVITLILWLLTFKKNTKNNSFNSVFIFFLVLGVFGSLPLMLTMVQKKFYFMPSISFFALAFSVLIVTRLDLLITRYLKNEFRVRVFTLFTTILLVCSVIFSVSRIGKYSRDELVIKDTKIIGNYLPEESIISTDKETYYSWSFHFYLLRRYRINIDPNIYRSKYFVTSKKVNDYFKMTYSKIDLPTKQYHLYVLKSLSN